MAQYIGDLICQAEWRALRWGDENRLRLIKTQHINGGAKIDLLNSVTSKHSKLGASLCDTWEVFKVQVDGMSIRQVAREFGLARKTIRKMLAYSVPTGYERKKHGATAEVGTVAGNR
jgi:hypothetical protein